MAARLAHILELPAERDAFLWLARTPLAAPHSPSDTASQTDAVGLAHALINNVTRV
jgi:hypothetical protein